MKNLKIFALLIASITASQSYGAAHITLAIPPLAGFAVGAMDLMKNRVAAQVLTGMAASTPSTFVQTINRAGEVATSDEQKIHNNASHEVIDGVFRGGMALASIPLYVPVYFAKNIFFYALGIATGGVARMVTIG